ncbi:MAG: ABC transporter ATP-binding protein [Phycisphaerales bacterium]
MFSKFKSIWALSIGNRGEYAAAIAAMVLASCFLYAAPLIPQVVIDHVIQPIEAEGVRAWCIRVLGGREFILRNLWVPCLLMAAVAVMAGIFTYLRGRWSAHASEATIRRVRDEIYDHIQRLPASYFDTAQTGDLVQRATSDVETLRMFMASQVVEIGRALIMLLLPLPLMLSIDVGMTIASTVFIPIIVLFSVIFFTRVKSAFQKADEAEGALTTVIQENLTGIRVVRAFARQEHESAKMQGANIAHRNLDNRLYWLMAWYWSLSDLLCMLQKALVIGAGAYWLATDQLEVGAFFFFLSAVMLFLWPMRMMGRILTDLGKALVAIERIRVVLDLPVESSDEADALQMLTLRGGIEFDDVAFAHGGTPVLRSVSFSVKPGETVALLGPSGSGKTTIINLLLRLYDPQKGEVRFDGVRSTAIPRRRVREQIAAVLQEPFLYSKTLRENMTLAHPSASDGELIEASTAAALHESIGAFDDGYHTMVGERGVTLSGGQRQRVAIARALLHPAPILVLDDSLSAVDTETESMILDALRQRAGQRTTIVIAHRLSTLMHADRILVIERGRVVQTGPHAQLLEEAGPYRRLWQLQTNAGDIGSDDDEDGELAGSIGKETRS